MKPLTLVPIVLLLIAPAIFAPFNCSLTSNQEQCINITNSQINESQKDQLLSGLLYNSTNYPDNEFIFNYNTNIKLNSSVINVTNSTYIKNAYLVLVTVMPSILENNTLYIPSTSFVLSDYSYEIYLPENYQSSGYSNTLNGDCKTIYLLVENTSIFNVLINDVSQSYSYR